MSATEQKMIKCQDSRDESSIHERPLNDVIAELRKLCNGETYDGCLINNEDIVINGIPCCITFFHMNFCGYVLMDKADKKYRDVDPDHKDINPHYGWTTHWGFDCGHYSDIAINFETNTARTIKDTTFKTRDFVYAELDAVTKAIVNIADVEEKKVETRALNGLDKMPPPNENAVYDPETGIFFPEGRGNGGFTACKCGRPMFGMMQCSQCYDTGYN